METAWFDSVDALTAAHFRGDVFIGNKKSLKCGSNSKKCGNVCIPKDHKCRASWNKPVKAAAVAGGAAAVAVGATALFHPRARARNAARGIAEPVAQGGFAVANVARGNFVGASKNVLNASIAGRGFRKNARTLAQEYGTDLKRMRTSVSNRFKKASFKAKNHRRAKGGRVPGLNYDALTPSLFIH